MKKLCSFLIAAALALSSIFIFTGCDKTKTDTEKFKDGYAMLKDAFSVMNYADEYEIDDANKIDLSYKLHEYPGMTIGDEPLILDLSFGLDDSLVIADGKLSYKETEVSGKAEIQDLKNLFLSVPGASDVFFYKDLESEDADDEYQDVLSLLKAIFVEIPDIFNTYVSDDYITVDNKDITSLGESISGAEAVTLTLSKNEIADIINKCGDILGKIESIEAELDIESIEASDLPDDASISISFFTSGKKLVKSELNITVAGYSVNLALDTDAGKDSLNAKFTASAAENSETIFELPINITYSESKNEFEGSFKIDLDNLKISDLQSSDEEDNDTAILTDSVVDDDDLFEDDDLVYDDNILGNIIDSFEDINISFSGTRSKEGVDITKSANISVSGINISIPFEQHIKVVDENTVEITSSIDYGIAGVKIKYDAVKTISHVENLSPTEYNMENGVELNAANFNDGNELYKKFTQDVQSVLESLEKLYDELKLDAFGLENSDEDIFSHDNSEGDSLSIYNDSIQISLWYDNSGEIQTYYDVTVDGNTYTLKSDSDEIKISFDDDDETVEVNGIKYEIYSDEDDLDIALYVDEINTYYLYSEDYSSSYTISEYGYATFNEDIEYTMDDSNLEITYIARNGETERFSYEINDDYFILDGVEYEYFYY